MLFLIELSKCTTLTGHISISCCNALDSSFKFRLSRNTAAPWKLQPVSCLLNANRVVPTAASSVKPQLHASRCRLCDLHSVDRLIPLYCGHLRLRGRVRDHAWRDPPIMIDDRI